MNNFKDQSDVCRKKKQSGLVLLSVLLLLSVVAAIAFISSRQGLVGVKQSTNHYRDEQVEYTVEGGLALAIKELESNTSCNNYRTTSKGQINGVDYKVALSATSGSPVTLTLSTLQDDLVKDFLHQVIMYEHKEVVLPARADATIDSGLSRRNKNYGRDDELELFDGLLSDKRILIDFDLSGLTLDTSKIISSRLEFSSVGAPETRLERIRLHVLEESWVESTLTWMKRNNNTNWSSRGGDYSSSRIATSVVYESTPGLYSWDIKSAVADWLDGKVINYGLILLDRSLLNGNRDFASRENADSSKHPRLRIAYRCECGSSCL